MLTKPQTVLSPLPCLLWLKKIREVGWDQSWYFLTSTSLIPPLNDVHANVNSKITCQIDVHLFLLKFSCRFYLFWRMSYLQNHCVTPKMAHLMLALQAYLIILQITVLHFASTFCCCFYEMKVCDNPASSKSINTIFFSSRNCNRICHCFIFWQFLGYFKCFHHQLIIFPSFSLPAFSSRHLDQLLTSSYWHQGKSSRQHKDFSSLRAQMMASIFYQ